MHYNIFMISTFRHKGLEAFHRQGQTKGIQQGHAKRLRGILALLESAVIISDMNVPGLRLHPLLPKEDGYWSVWIDANFRVTFRFENGNAYDIDVIDYH
jgi:toxin HigB-1